MPFRSPLFENSSDRMSPSEFENPWLLRLQLIKYTTVLEYYSTSIDLHGRVGDQKLATYREFNRKRVEVVPWDGRRWKADKEVRTDETESHLLGF